MKGAGRALVTGGGVRVGRAVSLALAAAGYDVAIHCHTSVAATEETAERIEERGRRSVVVRGDFADAGSAGRVVRESGEALGGLDLLVNSAAAFPRHQPERVTAAEWDAVFAVNARAPFFCAVAATALMGEAGGAIVNVADVAAFEAWPSYAPYAATKAALVSLTRSLAVAWAPRVRVNAVAPGPVLLPEGSTEDERRAAAESTALGRLGRAEDVADAVLYLAGADFVTGEVIRVDGGEHVARNAGR